MSGPITVKPVRTPKEQNYFLNLPWHIYKNDPLWVLPVRSDWKERIDPYHGVFFNFIENYAVMASLLVCVQEWALAFRLYNVPSQSRCSAAWSPGSNWRR
jgi:hypothetical protein